LKDKAEPTPEEKLEKMLDFGAKLFDVPKTEYDEREAKRKNRQKCPGTKLKALRCVRLSPMRPLPII
jgi:hypothetical protein